MSAVHLINSLKKHFKVAYDADLAKKLNCTQGLITLLRYTKNTEATPSLIIRCYDYAGYSVEKTRELFKQ